MSYFPMMVELENKKVLVVGAGEEGTKKVEVLCKFGARVTVVAESVSDRAIDLAQEIFARRFKESDIDGKKFALVVAATNDPETNRKVSELAQREKIPVNVVDNTPLCTFIFPAVVKEDEVVCAVSSGGRSPYVAQYIKEQILKVLPDNIGSINEQMGKYRIWAKENIKDKKRRRAFLKQRLDEMLPKGYTCDGK